MQERCLWGEMEDIGVECVEGGSGGSSMGSQHQEAVVTTNSRSAVSWPETQWKSLNMVN